MSCSLVKRRFARTIEIFVFDPDSEAPQEAVDFNAYFAAAPRTARLMQESGAGVKERIERQGRRASWVESGNGGEMTVMSEDGSSILDDDGCLSLNGMVCDVPAGSGTPRSGSGRFVQRNPKKAREPDRACAARRSREIGAEGNRKP